MSPASSRDELRAKIIGLGEQSARKSYYPELQKKLADLERYKELLDKTSEGIIQAEANSGLLIEINEAAAQMLNLNRAHIRDISIYDLLAPEVSVAIRTRAGEDEHIASMASLLFTSFILESGQTLFAELSIRFIVFKNQKYLVIIIRDITAKKIADDNLRESEERMRAIAEQLSELVFIADDESIIRYASPAVSRIFGLPPGFAIGKHISSFIAEGDSSGNASNFLQGIYNGAPASELEIRLKHADGSLFYGEISATRFVSRSIQGILGIVRDITGRVQSDILIRKLSKGVEQSSAAILITDPDGVIEYVNSRFTVNSGYPPEEALGKTPRILKSELTPPQLYKEMWDTITAGRDWQGEILNRKKNGDLYWEHIVISPVMNATNTIINFIGILEDITEKKKMLDELILAKEKAEQMNKAKSAFFANMSHELRTPLVGILGNADLLQTDVLDPNIRKRATTIFTSGKRLLETLNQILNITKMESDSAEIRRESVDILQITDEVIDLFRSNAAAKDLWLRKHYTLTKATALLNKPLLLHILNNLINNAIKFTDAGGIDVFIFAEEADSQENIFISVKDTGIGIPEEDLQLIWEEFRQVSEGIGRSFEGTGLGLTITKRFVEKLGGKITVESEINKGSVFTISFPARSIVS